MFQSRNCARLIYRGILIPLLKKPQADPARTRNYCPVILSTVFSKIAEMCVLDQCSDHEFSDLQFGFMDGRGTSMAVSLAEDVTTYCVDRGSPVFTCSLDAESPFNGLPHPMLFYKTTNIVPDAPWRLWYFWYLNQDVIVKWNNSKIANSQYLFR